MNGLRTLRLILAAIFLTAAIGCLFIPGGFMPADGLAWRVQIVPTALGATLGATLFWIVVSFLAGRVYCSTVCPVGSLIDLVILLRRKISKKPLCFSYRRRRFSRWDARAIPNQILVLYLLSLVFGILVVGYVIEPWNMMRNLASAVNPAATASTWRTLGISSAVGVAAGVLTVGGVLVWGFFRGRRFCNAVCPIGTVLGATESMQLFHLEIDPDKCINCMKCEDVCPAECIKVVGRYVDNGRCVRCFDCIAVCPNDAIRLQANRNRPANPLLRRTKKVP